VNCLSLGSPGGRPRSSLAESTIEIKFHVGFASISGGENISAIEVEDALCKHPAVLSAAVVATTDQSTSRRTAMSFT